LTPRFFIGPTPAPDRALRREDQKAQFGLIDRLTHASTPWPVVAQRPSILCAASPSASTIARHTIRHTIKHHPLERKSPSKLEAPVPSVSPLA